MQKFQLPFQLPFRLQEKLEQKKKEHTLRTLSDRRGLDFCSNDYLGLSEDLVLKERILSAARKLPLGSSASRLLRGNLEVYEEAEKELAEFSGSEAALLFPSGYQCNLGVLSALLSPQDFVYSDALNHASIIDGIKLSGAVKKIYPHQDVQALEQLLIQDSSVSGTKVIVTESIFSMDGDLAPLVELAALAKKYSALLVVDEAHATGLWGNLEQGLGAGWVQKLGLRSQVFATLHTGGKTLGVGGAWVALSQAGKDYLVNFSRPFIFSTAPMPVVACALPLAVQRWKEVAWDRVQELRTQLLFFRETLDVSGHPQAPILPVLVGDNQRCVEWANQLQRQGFDVRAIRPPTVPVGTARLRITLHWMNSNQDIQDLCKALKTEMRRFL